MPEFIRLCVCNKFILMYYSVSMVYLISIYYVFKRIAINGFRHLTFEQNAKMKELRHTFMSKANTLAGILFCSDAEHSYEGNQFGRVYCV